MTRVITYDEARSKLDWGGAVAALRHGHTLAKAEIKDVFLGPATGTMMSRSAYIPGLGYGSKTFTVFDGNAAKGLPTVQGAMLVFDAEEGALSAIVESRLVTEIKTAADSVLGAGLLARPDSKSLLIVGAGTVATSLIDAYTSVMPSIEAIQIWARRPEQAEALAAQNQHRSVTITAVRDLDKAITSADIVSSATMARAPILKGERAAPGTHFDLIGAFKADMREADDVLIARSSLFVDSRATTLGHIGELKIPLAAGVIREADVIGDLYDLCQETSRRRQSEAEVTLYKNGGGAHLDLMTALYIANAMG